MVNGRLPDSALSQIPGGRLEKHAAVAWRAMRTDIGARTGVWIRPAGPNSSYRTYAVQVYFWNLYRSGRGNLAAYPGTSNHGWGLAVDIATTYMAQLVNKYGAKYGWQKRWSDAQSEWWHFKYRAGIYRPQPNPYPTIRKGSHGPSVLKLQVLLRNAGYLPAKWHAHESYTLFVRKAVRKFQREHDLTDDGIVGNKTWGVLRRSAARRMKK